jgi:hypothetical protein
MGNNQSFLQYFKYPFRIWLCSILVGSLIYAMYTKEVYNWSDIVVGLLFYTLMIGLSSIPYFLIASLFYFFLKEKNIKAIIIKTIFSLLITAIISYNWIFPQSILEVGEQGNYLSPYFEGGTGILSLINGSVSIFFILIIKDKYKKEEIHENTEGVLK